MTEPSSALKALFARSESINQGQDQALALQRNAEQLAEQTKELVKKAHKENAPQVDKSTG